MHSKSTDDYFKIDNAEEHQEKYFAMLNNAVAVSGNHKLEGGAPKEAMAYYRYLLNIKLDCPSSLQLPESQFQTLNHEINKLIDFDFLLKTHSTTRLIDRRNGLDQVINQIKISCEESGVCYLPAGYRNKENGHFVGLKIRKLKNNKYAFSSINHGDGIRYHPKISISGSKLKRSYQSPEYEIDLATEDGATFLQKIIELSYNPNLKLDKDNFVNPYSAFDLYGLMKQYGIEQLTQDKLEQKGVTPQRSGTCTVTNVHAIARDILINQNADFNTRKRYHFILKLRSIIAGFNAYKQGKYSYAVMEWALREFSVRLNKQYKNILNDEETIYCAKLQSEIENRLKHDKDEIIAKKCEKTPLPANLVTDFPEDVVEQTGLVMKEKEVLQPQMAKHLHVDIPYPIKAEQLNTFLTICANNFPFNMTYEFLNRLPHCSGSERDEFWDLIPQNEIVNIIDNLFKIVEKLKQSENDPLTQRAQTAALALIAYDIVAQIAPRVSHFKLGGVFTLGLDDVLSKEYLFTDPIAYYTAKRVANNFEKRSIQKKRVFTNTVNLSNEYDATIHYVIRAVLTQQQRMALVKAMHQDENPSDQKMFEFLMENPTTIVNVGDLFKILSIAATAHALGNFTKIYKNDKNGFIFTQDKYHKEIERKLYLIVSTMAKHLLTVMPSFENEHLDLSENTIYHPRDDLKTIQDNFQTTTEEGVVEYSHRIQQQPYQPFLTGSLRLESPIWKIDDKDRFVAEELDEDLRHIECSPNLQVVRALTFALNHLEMLSNQNVRRRISELIFHYGKLDQALLSQSQTILASAEKLFNQLFMYCKEEVTHDLELILWAARLAYDFRYYVEVATKLYQLPTQYFSLPKFQEILIDTIKNTHNQEIRARLANQVVCDFRNNNPLTIEECCLLLVCRMIANLSAGSNVSDGVWDKLKTEVLQTFTKNKDQAAKILNELIQTYLSIHVTDTWTLDKFKLKSADTDCVIDLATGSLQIAGKNNLKNVTEIIFKDNKEFFANLNLTSDEITILQASDSPTTLHSSDGKWLFNCTNVYNNLSIFYTYQTVTIDNIPVEFTLVQDHDLQEKNGFYSRGKGNNPFESNINAGKYYQYWFVIPGYFFVQDKNDRSAYLYSPYKKIIWQLSQDEKGKWTRNGNIMLNLRDPKTFLENKWAKCIEQRFGTANIRCMGKVDQGKLKVKSLEIMALGLSFTLNDQQQFTSNQFPGYYLADEPSIEILNGEHIVILKDANEEKKYLIPAYTFKIGEQNNALNYENIFDNTTLINQSRPYYIYTQNSNNEFVADTPEAYLYLAILYRSQGDFESAMKYLEQSKTYKNINAEMLAIAMQVHKRKMISPESAAFDLKLGCYLIEHQQKWSENKEQLSETDTLTGEWKEFLRKQLAFYENTVSSFKNDVSIMPSYCRLNQRETNLLNSLFSKEQDKTLSVETEVNERVEQIKQLPFFHFWEPRLENKLRAVSAARLPSQLSTLRFYVPENKTPAFDYLVIHYKDFFKDAVSQDSHRINQLQKTLFALMQNDADPQPELYELISTLLMLTHCDQVFIKRFDPIKSMTDSVEMIIKVGEIFDHASYNQHIPLANLLTNLIEFTNIPNSLITETPLSTDFSAKPLQFGIGEIKYEKELKQPLVDLAKQYFNKTDVPIAKGEFALNLKELADPTLIEKELFVHYEKGHQENKTKMKAVYSTISPNLTQLKDKLEKVKHKDQRNIKSIKKELMTIANHTPLDDEKSSDTEKAQAYNLLQARASKQKHEITMSDLFTALLLKDPSRLTAQNPFLTQADISNLFAQLADLSLLQSRVDQISDTLSITKDKSNFDELEPYQLQMLAASLDKKRAYDIRKYPEFLIYEYATHRLLRDDQVNILIKLIELIEKDPANDAEMRHGLLQFAAGGGKTSVLIPILAERFARQGLLPVIFNTNELYQIGLDEIPKNLRASFKQNLEVIECELEHVWTLSELQKLLQDLERWREEGKCLLLKPVTWHSLNITMKLAYLNYQDDVANAANDVLNFFKERSVKLEDECHIVSDPMQESIKTYGKMRKIPNSHLDLIQRFYDYLLGYDKNSGKIPKLARINKPRKRSIQPAKLAELQEDLAKVICEEEIFASIVRKDLLKYLTQKDKKRPEWLNKLFYQSDDNTQEKNTANLVVLARAFIQTHLPHILSKQHLKDYGASIHKGDLTVAPKHESKDVSSHFGDPILVVSLTNQLYMQTGLSAEKAEQLLEHMLKEHREERKWNYNDKIKTQAEVWLMQVIPGFESYHDLTKVMRKKLSTDINFIKNPEVIRKYLRVFAMPQINVPENKVTSTAADLQAGFTRSILFSATPSLPQIYPAFINPENFYLEDSFVAQVIDVLLQQKNRGLATLKKIDKPTDFFKQLPNELLAKMTTLIDRGSLLTDYEALDVIGSYLGLDKEQVATKTAASFSKKALHLKSKEKHVKEVDISGAGLIDALKKQGIEPEKFLLFLFLDLSKTTGTDIKRPYSDHAGLTVGQEQTVTETVQAAMRERQLLDEDAQSITWIMFKSLYREIYPNSKDYFDPRRIFYWMIKNEAKQIESKLIFRAYQGIYQAISAIAWQEMKVNSIHRESFAHLLQEPVSLSPFLNYEVDTTVENTDLVLNEYLKELLKKFDFKAKNIKIPEETLARINKIIKETQSLINSMQHGNEVSLHAEQQQEMEMHTTMEQEQEQEQETEVKSINQTTGDFVFEIEKYGIEDSYHEIFDQERREVNKRYLSSVPLPGCENIKQPKLIFCPAHFSAFQKKGPRKNDTGIEQLKPIKMLLVEIRPGKEAQFLACTAAGAEYYSFLMRNTNIKNNDSAYMLISTEGEVLQMSNNISLNECQELIEQENSQKMLSYVHFLNGNINNPLRLSEVIQEQGYSKNDYEKLAHAITNVHVSQHKVSLLKNKLLNELCGFSPRSINTNRLMSKQQDQKSEQKLAKGAKEQKYHAIANLDNYMLESNEPIVMPEHAIEGYVLREKPKPIAHNNKPIYSRLKYAEWSIDNNDFMSAIDALKSAINQQLQSIKVNTLSTETPNIKNIFKGIYQDKFASILENMEKKLETLKLNAERKADIYYQLGSLYIEHKDMKHGISLYQKTLAYSMDYLYVLNNIFIKANRYLDSFNLLFDQANKISIEIHNLNRVDENYLSLHKSLIKMILHLRNILILDDKSAMVPVMREQIAKAANTFEQKSILDLYNKIVLTQQNDNKFFTFLLSGNNFEDRERYAQYVIDDSINQKNQQRALQIMMSMASFGHINFALDFTEMACQFAAENTNSTELLQNSMILLLKNSKTDITHKYDRLTRVLLNIYQTISSIKDPETQALLFLQFLDVCQGFHLPLKHILKQNVGKGLVEELVKYADVSMNQLQKSLQASGKKYTRSGLTEQIQNMINQTNKILYELKCPATTAEHTTDQASLNAIVEIEKKQLAIIYKNEFEIKDQDQDIFKWLLKFPPQDQEQYARYFIGEFGSAEMKSLNIIKFMLQNGHSSYLFEYIDVACKKNSTETLQTLFDLILKEKMIQIDEKEMTNFSRSLIKLYTAIVKVNDPKTKDKLLDQLIDVYDKYNLKDPIAIYTLYNTRAALNMQNNLIKFHEIAKKTDLSRPLVNKIIQKQEINQLYNTITNELNTSGMTNKIKNMLPYVEAAIPFANYCYGKLLKERFKIPDPLDFDAPMSQFKLAVLGGEDIALQGLLDCYKGKEMEVIPILFEALILNPTKKIYKDELEKLVKQFAQQVKKPVVADDISILKNELYYAIATNNKDNLIFIYNKTKDKNKKNIMQVFNHLVKIEDNYHHLRDLVSPSIDIAEQSFKMNLRQKSRKSSELFKDKEIIEQTATENISQLPTESKKEAESVSKASTQEIKK